MENVCEIPIFLNRCQIADRLGLSRPYVNNRMHRKPVAPDALDFKGTPLYRVARFPEIAEAILPARQFAIISAKIHLKPLAISTHTKPQA
jgi:hypothetical protein